MADFRNRHLSNVAGKFYTDILCLDCVLCRELVPTVFRRHETRNLSYVFQQPTNSEEMELCLEAARRCPCQAIGADGELHDWAAEPSLTGSGSESHEARRRDKFSEP